MKHTYTVSQAQSQLPQLIKEAEAGEPVCIRRRDETVAYVISRERMDAIVETLEILANPTAMSAIEAHRAGKTRFFPLGRLDSKK